MKHGELIKAAVDGKPIQWRYATVGQHITSEWRDFGSQEGAVVCLASRTLDMPKLEYRIKPEPVPDKVYYIPILEMYPSLIGAVARILKPIAGVNRSETIKFTIKTDENGKETKTVEIVE